MRQAGDGQPRMMSHKLLKMHASESEGSWTQQQSPQAHGLGRSRSSDVEPRVGDGQQGGVVERIREMAHLIQLPLPDQFLFIQEQVSFHGDPKDLCSSQAGHL